MATAQARVLDSIFNNGFVEVGLEVGTDAGLSVDEYIRIPNMMRRRVWASACDVEPAFGTDAAPGNGWTDISSVACTLHNNVLVANAQFTDVNGANIGSNIVRFVRTRSPTADEIKAFIAVNANHIRADEISAAHVSAVHAIRFWSVVAGYVNGTRSQEFVAVDDPGQAEIDMVSDADVAYVVTFAQQAFTALAARAASWRKTNHATGGEIASGFPRRWLQKNGMWTAANQAQVGQSRGSADAANRVETSAFYIATHAAAVHTVLAHMAPSDPNHWAAFTPQWGFIQRMEVKTSARIRLVSNTQVAGVAMVADAVVVLKSLIDEGTAGLLKYQSQVGALAAQYTRVVDGGIRCASYSAWFLDGHPTNVVPEPFNQKEASCAQLIGELGAVATKYLDGTTISESKALENAVQQMCPTEALSLWTTLARSRATVDNAMIIKAWSRIRGGSNTDAITHLASDDTATVNTAVTEYNTVLNSIATAFGITSVPTVIVDMTAATVGGAAS